MTSPSALHTPGWRTWTVWIVGVAAYVVAITNRTSLSSVGVDAAIRFDADASALSMFAVIQLAVYGSLQVPVGLILDRLGARPVIAAGMVLMATGQLVMAFADAVGIGILARVLIGAGDAAVFPSVLRVIATWFPAQRSPLLVQLTGIIGQLGQIVAVVPLAALLHATSWSVAFGSLAGLTVLFAVLTFAVIRNRPPERRDDPLDTAVDTDTGAVRIVRSAADLREGFRESWSHPATRLGFWSHFTTPFAGTAFVLLWGYPFLTAGEGLRPAAASGLMTLLVLAGIVFGPILGALSSRHPTRRSRWLVLPTVVFQAVAWLAVIVWPGAGRTRLDDRLRPCPRVQSDASPEHGDRHRQRRRLPRRADRDPHDRRLDGPAGRRHTRDLLAGRVPHRLPHPGAAVDHRFLGNHPRAQPHDPARRRTGESPLVTHPAGAGATGAVR